MNQLFHEDYIVISSLEAKKKKGRVKRENVVQGRRDQIPLHHGPHCLWEIRVNMSNSDPFTPTLTEKGKEMKIIGKASVRSFKAIILLNPHKQPTRKVLTTLIS